MRYYLTGIDEGKREIYMTAQEDESLSVTIDASDAAWTGVETDLEVVPAVDGATVYYWDAEGNKTFKNYRFTADGVVAV